MLDIFILFLIPFAAALIALLAAPFSKHVQKRMAVAMSFVPLFYLAFGNLQWIGSQFTAPWLAPLSIEFFLRIDPLSLLFLFLTCVVVSTALLAVRNRELPFAHIFYALVFFLQGLLLGFFMARDLALFTFFWEGMLLPLYFLITLWGGPKRQSGALTFIVYMIAGSALMIAAVLALYLLGNHHTFNLDLLAESAESSPYAAGIFAIFLLAFAVKTPLFPFHAWLPDAYCQASTPGTILLAGILSKAGIYGILRIGMGLFPALLGAFSPWLLGLAIAGVFYGGLVAWMQNDFKRLLAYSSLAHINFVLAGLFIASQTAEAGAILQAVNHGITISALFLTAGWLEQRLGTTAMESSGLAKYMPKLCWLTLFFVLSSVALPGTNNFIGEFFILFGLYSQNPWLAAFLGLTVILTVVYMLRWMQKMYFQEPSPVQDSWQDIKTIHLLIAAPLAALILWIGIYPAPFLDLIKSVVEKIHMEPIR